MPEEAHDAPGPMPARLEAVLVEAQARGLAGSMSLEEQVAHSLGFATAFEATAPAGPGGSGDPERPAPLRWLDLGSGGGLPGLVLALAWPSARAVLVDAAERRAEFLAQAVASLGVGDRVEVVEARAEDAGRRPELRATFDLVVARSFGPPAVTAECASPFLRVGGLLIVSEPPAARDTEPASAARWPADGLAPLGLEPLRVFRTSFGYQILRQTQLCPERFPRRSGIVAKRPLYRHAGR